MGVNDTILTPSQAAQRVGVGAHNIRRWCEWHSTHLSEGASPKPGAPRRLTLLDVEVLKAVNDLRKQGLQTTEINERLAGMTFAVVDNSIDSAPIVESPHAAPASPPQAITPLMVVDALQSALAPVEARLDARLQALEAQRLRVDVVFIAVGAFIAGVIVGLAVWWFQ